MGTQAMHPKSINTHSTIVSKCFVGHRGTRMVADSLELHVSGKEKISIHARHCQGSCGSNMRTLYLGGTTMRHFRRLARRQVGWSAPRYLKGMPKLPSSTRKGIRPWRLGMRPQSEYVFNKMYFDSTRHRFREGLWR